MSKTLLLIDPNVTRRSPSMKAIVETFPRLREAGFEIEAWCWEIEPGLEGVRAVKLPRFPLPLPAPLVYWWFALVANLYGIWCMAFRRSARPDVIQTTGFYYLFADVSFVHFSHFDWVARQRQIGVHGLMDVLAFLQSFLGLLSEIILFWNPFCRHLVPVSEAVAGDIRRWGPSWKRLTVLPNAYDAERFSPAIRDRHRTAAREENGFAETDRVFAFASAGHHRRKGFWLAVAAIAELRRRGRESARLLVIGGGEKKLDALRRKLAREFPDWEAWIRFTGMVRDMPRALAAADAFLYPSYSEAFALVEIEAAAMGLPLYLTPHHGSEMILEEGRNGRAIAWDPAAIAELLDQELAAGKARPGESSTVKALDHPEYAARFLSLLREEILAKAGNGPRKRAVPTSTDNDPDNDPLPRLLLIGHTYALAQNREKIRALAAHFQVTCITSTLSDEKFFGRDAAAFEDDDSGAPLLFAFHRLASLGRHGKTTQFFYAGLRHFFASQSYDIILVEAEPWSFLRWQSWWLKRRFQAEALFGEFTWENVRRPEVKGSLLNPIYRLAARTSDYVICGNNAAAANIRAAGKDSAEILIAPQLGIDPQAYCPVDAGKRARLRSACGLDPKAFVIGYCGRLVEEKGISALLAAAREARPATGIQLALLGAGPLQDQIEAACAGNPWIRLLPPCPHRDVPRFLQCLDLLVLPSRPLRRGSQVWEEQFGHVLIEAMACGVPTIGSNSGAIPEVIGDPEAIFPWGEHHALAALIEKAGRDGAWRHQLAARQQRRVFERFTHEVVAGQYAKFLLPRLRPGANRGANRGT